MPINVPPLSGASSRSRVIRCLIPRTSVPCNTVLKALGCVKTLPLSVQLLLFRWIVMVFDLVDDRSALHCVYSVVFYHLQVDDLVRTSFPASKVSISWTLAAGFFEDIQPESDVITKASGCDVT